MAEHLKIGMEAVSRMDRGLVVPIVVQLDWRLNGSLCAMPGSMTWEAAMALPSSFTAICVYSPLIISI